MVRPEFGDHLAGRDVESGEQVDGSVSLIVMGSTMSRILATSCGSGEILNSTISHGFNPNARQISDTI